MVEFLNTYQWLVAGVLLVLLVGLTAWLQANDERGR